MAISGMTGFARTDGAGAGATWRWEARSVNGKGLDVKVRLPPGADALEPAVRAGCAERFSRGSIQVALTIELEAQAPDAASQLDLAVLEAFMQAAAPYVRQGLVAPPSWDGLLRLRGALPDPAGASISDVATAHAAALEADLAKALDALAQDRRAEGESLRRILLGHLDALERVSAAAAAEADVAPAAIQARLRARLESVLTAGAVDPARLAQEVALLAAKADVTEELDRLRAHIAQARALVGDAAPGGRKLGFLTQEMNREANTLCAKSSELALTRAGLELKAIVDQIREQAANVE